MSVLTTKRLRLEPIEPRHVEGLCRINGDPEVMRYIGGVPESAEATRDFAERVRQRWSEQPFSWWAFLGQDGDLVGCGPLQHLEGDPAKPHEIGWRIRRDLWGLGYAPEAATAIAYYAFKRIGIPVLLAVASPGNVPSIRVMQKIGMRHRGLETHYGKSCATYELRASELTAGETGAGHAEAH